MAEIARTTLLSLVAFLGWLGLSYLAFIAVATTQSQLASSWLGFFPIAGVLPALLLAGGVASYIAADRWFVSSACAGVAGSFLLWLFASFSGVWWAVITAGLFGVLLAIVGGFAFQFLLRRGK